MANIPDNRFISSTSLEEYFVDKSSGLPLSGGYVYFYRDISRTTPKLVYQLTGDPATGGGYSFAPLSNPVRLSANGTFQDNDGNNIALYYFPYDGLPATSLNKLDLYYVVVTDFYGAEQFTRQAWPSIAEDLAGSGVENVYYNELSNSQFVDVFFDKYNFLTYAYSAGTSTVSIAPGWDLVLIANGSGSVTVTRNRLPGGPPVLTNPPYTLTFVPGLNLTSMSLVQKLDNNPGIWSRNSGVANGYISGGILLYSNSQVTMRYVPNAGASKTILVKNNATSSPVYYNATVQLPVSNNPATSTLGYVNIYLDMPVTGPGTTLSSVQVTGLASNQVDVPYVQQPVNRQKDYLFHYYNELLQFKPTKSYLTGWDFPLNPAQFGSNADMSGSANMSAYAWDQTIIYSSSATGIRYLRHTLNGGLRMIALNGPTKMAIIQYVSGDVVSSILDNDLSVNVSMSTSTGNLVLGTVSLWYTNDPLPNAGSLGANPNRSIVQTLASDGDVVLTYGTGWTRIPTDIPTTFTVGQKTVNQNYYNSKLTGWKKNTVAANASEYFAIVVGFSELLRDEYLQFNSISLVPGRIATIPAPQTYEEVLRDCQQYYWSTYYNADQAVGAITLAGAEMFVGTSAYQSSEDSNVQTASSFKLDFPARMRTSPFILLYSPQNGSVANIACYKRGDIVTTTAAGGSAFVSNVSMSLWSSSAGLGYVSKSSVLFDMIGQFTVLNRYAANIGGVPNPNIDQIFFSYHAVVDARLGVVS